MSDPLYNSVETNSLESVGRRKGMKRKKKTEVSMEDGDSAHWIKSKRKKVSSAGEAKRRFKANTVTVKPAGKKKIQVKK